MRILHGEKRILAVACITACLALPGWAQSTREKASANSQTSTNVSAEMVKGKLNPSTSKPGDQVAVRLNDDIRSNGQVVLKKGSTITGIVKSVKQADSKTKDGAQSMMEIEWLTPEGSAAGSQNLNFALQSLAYTNPMFAHQQQQDAASSDDGLFAAAPQAQPASGGTSSRQGGGLLGGVVTSASSTVGAATSITQTASAAGPSRSASGKSNTGLLATSTSSVLTDAGTATALHNNFGVANDQLFTTGHGQVISAGGSRESVDMFSHLSNDTVITSPSKSFEVASGAQMQFLVGVKQP